ncbi:MAG: ABC transporter permease [Lachnospiraceae bacterium]|nr:ABC transporter permease [Lachnospiraceae bacterium]
MKNKIRINPILKKEMVVGSRSMKMSWAIMAVSAILTAIVVFTLLVSQLNVASGATYDYSTLIVLFPVLGIAECIMLSLMVPVITSGSISGEREKQTLDIMLTTPISPFSIVLGKLMSAMMIVMMYMIASVPVMAITFVLGGLSWWNLIGLFIILIYLGIYVGSVGIFCSSVVKKSIAATILTIVIGLAIIIGTSLIYSVSITIMSMYYMTSGNMRPDSLLGPVVVFMFNPYSPIFDFMVRALSDSSIYDMVSSANINPVMGFLYRFWIPISMGINLLISFGFLKLAAARVGNVKTKKAGKVNNKAGNKAVQNTATTNNTVTENTDNQNN